MITRPGSSENTSFSEEILSVRDLMKVYKGAGNFALKGLTISVAQKEIFGLLGPNGAGKTTVISIMSSLLQPTDGKVTVCGIDISEHPDRVKNLIGLVPQDIALYSELTGLENLQYFGKLYGLRGQELRDHIKEYLDLFQLQDKAGEPVYTYSGGIKRRFNLVAGILHKPRLLFLDEPTVGIDAQSRNLIFEKLEVLSKAGTAMIYTTHYMEEAETLCSRIAIMDEGKIIAQGAPSDLVKQNPECRNLGDLFLFLTGKSLRD
jgi:ABC-2 type transport system ATP-binding protein